MTDRFAASVRAAALLLAAAACTPDQPPVATSTAALPAESLDLSQLSGKSIVLEDPTRNEGIGYRPRLRIIGKTIIWNAGNAARCIVRSERANASVLYRLNEPQVGVKIPCERLHKDSTSAPGYDEESPADASYSSTVFLRGDTLELNGALRETSEYHSRSLFNFDLLRSVELSQHLKVRIRGDKCELITGSEIWMTRERRKDEPTERPPGRTELRYVRCWIEPRQ